MTPAINFSPVSLTPLSSFSPVSLTPVININLRISPRIYEKILNGPNCILGGLGDTDSWKKNWGRKSRVRLPLKTKTWAPFAHTVFVHNSQRMAQNQNESKVLYVTSLHLYCLLQGSKDSWMKSWQSLKSFPTFLHSHLYNFALRFIFFQTHATSYSSYSSVTAHCKVERRKTWWKTIPPFLWFKKSITETPSLRTLKIMPRNLNDIVCSWIRLLYAGTMVLPSHISILL